MEALHSRSKNELDTAFMKSTEMPISEVFNDTYAPLVDYAFQLVRDWEEAQNLAVQSFLQLLEKRANLDDRPGIVSFLYVATRNNCYMHLRKVNSATRFREEAQYLGKDAAESQPEYDFAKMDVEIMNALYAEMAKLPAQCRTIFSLRYLENIPTDKIAEQLGIERKTVQNQILKASKIIKSAFSARKLYPASFPLFLLSFLF